MQIGAPGPACWLPGFRNWNGEHTRPACPFGRPLAREVRGYFTGPPKLPPLIFSGRSVRKGLGGQSFRRDAENHTPAAYAPRIILFRPGLRGLCITICERFVFLRKFFLLAPWNRSCQNGQTSPLVCSTGRVLVLVLDLPVSITRTTTGTIWLRRQPRCAFRGSNRDF